LCTNDGACVEVCPVACIHTRPGAPQFYIDPDVCIDCEQCEIVCPVDAIFKDFDVPAEHMHSIDVNAAFFRQNKAVVGPVSFETAWQMVHRAHAFAKSVGIAVTAAVVDEAGIPIAVGRMDGAATRTTELAVSKAYTAAAFHLATADLAAQARQPWLKSLVVAHRPRLLPCANRVLPLLPPDAAEALIDMVANALVTSYRTSSTGGSPRETPVVRARCCRD
jgi:ferredoxin